MDNNDKVKLKHFLEGFYASRGLSFSPAVCSFWFSACQHVDYDAFERAFLAHVNTNPNLPTPFDITKCSENVDLHMPPEQAWNYFPKSEYDAAYVTREMCEAFSACYDSLMRGDFIAARLAFIEKYKNEIAKSHATGIVPRWFYSDATGIDRIARAFIKIEKTVEAAEKKWITPTKALDVLNIISSEHGIALEKYHARLQNLCPMFPQLTTGSSNSKEGMKKISDTVRMIMNGKIIGKDESPTQKEDQHEAH